jgi:seryl-tRNA synthetase
MINIKKLRESPDTVRAALVRRDPAIADALEQMLRLDESRREILAKVERLKADRNRSSEEVSKLKKEKADASELLVTLRELSGTIKELDQKVRSVEEELDSLALQVPNLPLDELPDGGAEDYRVVRSWGEPESHDFDARPHWELGESLGILDLPRGAKISGSGFPMFVGMGARLVRSLVNMMLEVHVQEHGYLEIAPPLLVNEDSARGTGQLPDLEDNMYVTKDGLYLVPTAEVPVTNFHRNDVLPAEALPRAFVAHTPCFRREAGAHGADTRGIIRVHQFDKVELVRMCRPENSPSELELLLGHAEKILQMLELPYRVIQLAAGDIGFSSAMTYDIEVWAAGVGKWLEVSSVSTFTDFQARRANIRYKPEPQAKPDFVHTLNGSALALPRTIIPLLENNQQPDGSVELPAVLAPYLGDTILKPHGDA